MCRPAAQFLAHALKFQVKVGITLGKRKIRTFVLPDDCELDTEACIAEVVGDELLHLDFVPDSSPSPGVGTKHHNGPPSPSAYPTEAATTADYMEPACAGDVRMEDYYCEDELARSKVERSVQAKSTELRSPGILATHAYERRQIRAWAD